MAVEGDELDLQSLPPITAVCWSVFQCNPRVMYNLIQPLDTPGNFHSDVVFDLTGSTRELKVETVEDLHRLTKDILRMPLLFRATIKHQKTEYVLYRVRRVWTDAFAFLVNTQHPTIREVFSRRLSEAMQLMQDGKKFCIKIDFGQSVRQWYARVVDGEVSLCFDGNSDDGRLSVIIHNSSTPVDRCLHPGCIICCFPFWLLFGGPCYCAYRSCNYTDEYEEVRNLPVKILLGQRTFIIEDYSQQLPGMGPQGQQYGNFPPGAHQGGQYTGPLSPGQFTNQYIGPPPYEATHRPPPPGQYNCPPQQQYPAPQRQCPEAPSGNQPTSGIDPPLYTSIHKN